MATETRATELFKRDGKSDGQQSALSDIIVYQSRVDEKTIHECRLINAVDGKPVAKREKEIQTLFAKLAQAKTLSEEYQIFAVANAAHALRYSSFGRTVDSAWMLEKDEWTAQFEFNLAGREQLQGHKTIIVAFRRKKALPLTPQWLITKSVSDDFKTGASALRGRLWLDAETARVWRTEYEEELLYPDTTVPLLVRREVMEYAPSDYGILTPKHFVLEWNFHSWREKDGARKLALRCRFVDDYSAFRRFSVSGQEDEKKPIIK